MAMDPTVTGVVLAGGLARRMGGGDKPLLPLAGRPLLAHVLDRLAPQVGHLVLNANGDPARLHGFGLHVVADAVPGHPGPLAGILAGLDWAAHHMPQAPWVVTVPSDCPFLPPDLVSRLQQACHGAACACAASAGRLHPVIGVWHSGLRTALRAGLLGGMRRVQDFAGGHGMQVADFPAEPFDPFFNVNTPAGLAEAHRLAAPRA